MSDQAPPVSIVIPAKNEEARLPSSIRELRHAFPDEPWEFLIVVEPGTDSTAEAARKSAGDDARFRVIENPQQRGKGFAVKTGMLAARGEKIFFMDADLSVPPRTVRDFIKAMNETGADVCVGSRRHAGSRILIHQNIPREAAGRAFNYALRIFGATRMADTQCGFKLFNARAAHEIFSRLQLDGFGFDVEVLALAEALGLRILELPVEWADSVGSKVRPLQDGLAALKEAILAARRVRRELC